MSRQSFVSIDKINYKKYTKYTRPRPIGVLLRKTEIYKLDKIAIELGTTRHQLLKFSVKSFMSAWEKEERKNVIKKNGNYHNSKSRSLGILLDKNDIDKLDQIATELETTRHHLLIYSVRLFLQSWFKGYRPKTTIKIIRVPQIEE